MDQYTKVFWHEGLFYAKHDNCNSSLTGHRIFKSFYGISPNVCAVLWRLIGDKPSGAEPKH